MDNKKTIAVDFDGVIHGYSKGWQDGSIYDPPIPGVQEALAKLREEFIVVIWSTRCHDRVINGVAQKNQVQEVVEYLDRHGIPHDGVYSGEGKPFCACLIDDRAVRFRSWDQAVIEAREVANG